MSTTTKALAAARAQTRRAQAQQLAAAAVADGRISQRNRQQWEDAVAASARAERQLADLAPVGTTTRAWDL